MKLTKYALMAAGCAMFAACSSDEPVQDEAVNPNAPAEAAAGEGYVALEIKLPQVAGLGSRADAEPKPGTPSYDDGDAQEYAVVSGQILVFKNGATEADAEYVSSSPLSGLSWSPAAGNQNVTTTSTAVAKLSGVYVNNDDKYFAVVVLNAPDNFPMPAGGTKFSAWSTTASNCSMIKNVDGKNYLTMSSAALLNGATPTVLTSIDKDKIKATEADAIKAGKAATFYVQRAVAKVTTKFAANYTPTGEDYKQDKVVIEKWMCDLTNKTGYPVQVTAGLNNSSDPNIVFPAIWSTERFYDKGATPQRVYWGIDPNYANIGEDDTAGMFNNYTAVDLDNAGLAAGEPQYILENTFGIEDQNTWETTRVIIKANYTPAGFNSGDTYYRIKSNSKNYNKAGLENAIKAQIVIAFNQEGTVDLGAAATTAGVYSLSDMNITINGAAATQAQLDKVAQGLGLISGTDNGFSTYQSGVTYYQARIKHFNELTPWELGNDTYGGNCEKWLGRYGVVRNNSYEVNINSISAPGSAIVPPIEPGPDDESNYYISVTINLLSWAKRVQNVDL